MVVTLLSLALVAVALERGRGNYHRIRTAVLHEGNGSAQSTSFGGQEPIHLQRTPDGIEGEPEFLSATLLPGRGLNIFQITANIPGHGEVALLASPPLAEAASQLTDTGADANGVLGTSLGAAFMTPWAERLSGRPSDTPGILQSLWVGQRLTFPAASAGSLQSTRGLLLDRGADSTHTDPVLGGQTVEATFHPGTFSGNWPSTGSVHISAALNAHSMDIAVAVQNTGTTPMPVGIGWLPHFAIASHNRAAALLTVPSRQRLELDRSTGLPTGGMVTVAGTGQDFSAEHGTRLGQTALDVTYAHLQSSLGGAAGAELRDPAFGYGLRVVPASDSIRGLHVVAPADQDWVVLAPETNFDDPLGQEWTGKEDSGIRTLQPGESLQWKVRLELISLRSGR